MPGTGHRTADVYRGRLGAEPSLGRCLEPSLSRGQELRHRLRLKARAKLLRLRRADPPVPFTRRARHGSSCARWLQRADQNGPLARIPELSSRLPSQSVPLDRAGPLAGPGLCASSAMADASEQTRSHLRSRRHEHRRALASRDCP